MWTLQLTLHSASVFQNIFYCNHLFGQFDIDTQKICIFTFFMGVGGALRPKKPPSV